MEDAPNVLDGCAHHEAGRAVVADLLGYQVSRVVIFGPDDGKTFIGDERPSHEHDLMIALAGFAAESKRYDVKASHANRDRGQVLNAALHLSNGDLNRANALRKRKEIEVSIMVDADWQRIEALARRLTAEMEVHWPFGEQKGL